MVKVFLATPNIYTYYTFSDLLHPTQYSLVGWSDKIENAFRVVAEKKPDVVVTDIMFNNFIISDFLYGIKAINPEIKTILLGTPFQLNSYLNAILQVEFDGIMFKPLQENSVLNVLGALIPPKMTGKIAATKVLCQIVSNYFNEVLLYSSRRLKPTIIESIIRVAKHEKLSKEIHIEIGDLVTILPKPYVRFEKLRDSINVFYSKVIWNLNQRVGPQVTFSLLQEAYQTFYPKNQVFMEQINYEFPTVNGFHLRFIPLKEEIISLHGSNLLTEQDTNALKSIDEMTEQKFQELFMEEHLRKDIEVYVVISTFDDIKGPTAVLVVPTPSKKSKFQLVQTIPSLLDFTGVDENEPFIHASMTWGSINVLFTLENKMTRGQIQENLLSIVITNISPRILALLSRLSSVLKLAVNELKELIKMQEGPPLESLMNMIIIEYLHDFHSDLTTFFTEKIQNM